MSKLIRLFKELGKVFVSPQQKKALQRHALVGSASLWKMKREFQDSFLKAQGLKPDQLFLDLGCGTLRGGIPVVQVLDPGGYYGVDVRAEAIAEGHKEVDDAGLAGKHPTLIHATDLTELSIDQSFDIIWSFSVLIHFSDDILDDALGFVGKHLKQDGKYFANVNIGEREEAEWQGFPVVWRSLDFYRDVSNRHGLAVRDLGSLESFGHHSGSEAQDEQRMLEFVAERH